jgi:hypothetical protein
MKKIYGSDVPSSDPGRGLHRHLLKVDPSLLSRDDVGLLEMDPGSLQKLLEKLELCQTVALQALESALMSTQSIPEDQLVVVVDQDHPSSHCTTEEKTSHLTNTSLQSEIPVEVLHQVCQSEFLTTEEVGRLLLLVSKSFIYGLGKEHTWEII